MHLNVSAHGLVVALAVMARVASAGPWLDEQRDCPHDGKTIPIARGPVTVDGVLDDATWQQACFASDFEQKLPRYHGTPSHPMRVALAIDGDTLYVGARMYSAGRADIDDALTQRDDTSQAEHLIVSLDPSHTKRIAFSFAVTAAGVRADWIHTDDNEGSRDLSWNPVWTAKTTILDDGWVAEMAIPLSQLRLPREPADSWGINFNWYIPHRNEDVFWRAVPPDRTAWASWFGEVTALPAVKPGLGLELLPYVASFGTIDEVEPDAPAKRFDHGLEAGLDAKLHPLPGLVVAATINPDFGQVDADPGFVNLTAYEVRLPERRPFFVENNSLLTNAGGNYFYSRRIGGLPRGGTALPAYDSIAIPPEIRILGAAAAGGYVAPSTQIATLAAITEETRADALVGGEQRSLVVSPLTAWFAGRVEQQVGASVLGATATAVDRRLDGTGLEDLMPKTALVVGADAKLRTSDGTYELAPYAGITTVAGTAGAITAVEESSAHLFQRPDAPEVHLDTAATRLTGWHGGATASKRAGAWHGTGGLMLWSPSYEINDLGTLQAADWIYATLDVRYIDVAPGNRLLTWTADAGSNTSWNFGGLHRPTDVHANVAATTTGFYYAELDAAVQTNGGSDDLTRGGPAMQIGWAAELVARASTPNGRARQLSATIEGDVSPTLRQGVIASATLSARIVPALRLDLTPSLTVVESHRQYVTEVDDGENAMTFGPRYIFGHLHRRETALELRATWSLSPDLALTLYAQPFASVGRYSELGELAAAGSGDLRWYANTSHAGAMRQIDDPIPFSIAEPDFTVVSLRSTAVLRWELRPGSTLFVVWQQSRGGVSTPVAQPLHSVLPDVATQSAIHTVAIKLSFWFG